MKQKVSASRRRSNKPRHCAQGKIPMTRLSSKMARFFIQAPAESAVKVTCPPSPWLCDSGILKVFLKNQNNIGNICCVHLFFFFHLASFQFCFPYLSPAADININTCTRWASWQSSYKFGRAELRVITLPAHWGYRAHMGSCISHMMAKLATVPQVSFPSWTDGSFWMDGKHPSLVLDH